MKPPQSESSVVTWHQDWAFFPHTNDSLVTVWFGSRKHQRILLSSFALERTEKLRKSNPLLPTGGSDSSLHADVLCGSFVTHSGERNARRTNPKGRLRGSYSDSIWEFVGI